MLFSLTKKELERVRLPFNTFVPDISDIEYSLRLSYYRHPTLVFELPQTRIRVKEFFMDWFYYGFPKNQMISANDFYDHTEHSYIERYGEKYPLFTGKDYTGSNSSCVFLEGTCMEIRHEESQLSDVVQFLENSRILSYSQDVRYYDRSFYSNLKAMVFWFEEERMNRLEWTSCAGDFTNNYSIDSVGKFKDIQTLIILKNVKTDYMFVDISKQNTGVKNLKYNVSRNNSILCEKIITENSIIGSLSEHGPIIGQFSEKDSIITITIPRIKDFEHGIRQIMHMLKELRSKYFLGLREI